MLEGLYSAAAGMAAQQQRLDGVANDLANTNTPGYKSVRVAFRDLLYVPNRGGGQAGAGAAAVFAGRTHAPGALHDTGEPLDVALQGEGFIGVRRPDGSLGLTRAGALRLDGRGRLVTPSGDLVLGVRAVPRGVQPGQLAIAQDGTVRAGGRAIGRLQLLSVRSADGLRALGDGVFQPTAASGAAFRARGVSVRQGALESSNVDMASAMTDMMEAQRTFSLASRAVQMQDQLLQIANEVKK